MISNVRKGLDFVCLTAPQLASPQRWAALVRYIVEKIIAATPKKPKQPGLLAENYPPPILVATG